MNKYFKYILLALLTLNISGAFATLFLDAKNHSFPADSVINDDVIAVGDKIQIASDIKGDVIGASQEMVLSGVCEGSVLWAARYVTVNGNVNGSVRAVGQRIELNGPVNRNVEVFAQSISIGHGTQIKSDATILGEQIIIEGYIGRNARIAGKSVTISGTIGGNIDITADMIELDPVTVIEGNLTYSSPSKIKLEDGVVINGEINWQETEAKTPKSEFNAFAPAKFILLMYFIFNFFFGLWTLLVALLFGNAFVIPMFLLAMFASGIAVVSLNKKFTLKAMATMEDRLLVALGLGILVIPLTIIAAFLLMLTFILIPLGMLLVLLLGLFSFMGMVYVAQFTGSYVSKLLNAKRQPPSILCLIIGLITLGCLMLIPILGWVITLLALALGVGSIVLSIKKLPDNFMQDPNAAEAPEQS